MQATWQRLPLLFICLYRFFSLSSFFLFIYLFFPSNGTRHCATCQIVAAGRERGEKNKYRLHVCRCVCVCVCAGVVGKHKTMCVCVCVWMRESVVDFHSLVFVRCCQMSSLYWKKKKKKRKKGSNQWAVASEAALQIKTQAGETYWIVLSCRIASAPAFCFFFKKWPGVTEMRPNAPSQSIKSSSGLFACSLRRTGTTTVLCG